MQLAGGGTLTVEAVVTGGSDEVGTQADRASGAVGVTATGSSGARVTMVVTITQSNGAQSTGQLTFVSTGDASVAADTVSWTAGGELTGTVTNNGVTTTATNACFDGVKSGMETDIDCGAVCNDKCAVGKGCDGRRLRLFVLSRRRPQVRGDLVRGRAAQRR